MSTPQHLALKDPRLYVLAWLAQSQITINERGELKEPLNRHLPDIFDTMWLDYRSQVRAHNASEKQKAAANRNTVNPVAEKDMMKALNELISKEKATFRQRTIQSLKCDTEDLSELERFIEAVVGSKDETHIGVVAHWLWMIKNKMLSKDVSYHIMPILFGKQGGGKSVAVKKLIKPIENYNLSLSMKQITDDRYFFSMSENYIAFFDEMQGASKTDVNTLKNVITTEWQDARRLGTNGVFKVRQACSFIGATNKPVSEQIIDTTGMRRFWEIKTSDKLDWEVLNNIDFIALWQGIDENKEEGYIIPHLDKIRAAQAEMTIEDDLDSFLSDFSLQPIEEHDVNVEWVMVDRVYTKYKEWASNNGFRPQNKIWFGKRMSNKGFGNKQKKTGNKNYRHYHVCPGHVIDELPPEVAKLTNVRPTGWANNG